MNQEQSQDYAKKYLEDVLSFYGVNLDITVSTDDEIIELDVPSSDDSSLLIGRNADTLRSLQYILSQALRNNNAATARVNVDIAGYKKQRAEKLAEQAKEWIEEVRKSGDSHVARINAADRRIVHQVATEYEDIRTFSEGEGRERAIIIAQKTS